MRRPSYRPENQKPTRKIIQMIKRNCFQSVSQIDRSFKTKTCYAHMIKRGNGFEVSLKKTNLSKQKNCYAQMIKMELLSRCLSPQQWKQTYDSPLFVVLLLCTKVGASNLF